jgi:hypothetical protein
MATTDWHEFRTPLAKGFRRTVNSSKRFMGRIVQISRSIGAPRNYLLARILQACVSQTGRYAQKRTFRMFAKLPLGSKLAKIRIPPFPDLQISSAFGTKLPFSGAVARGKFETKGYLRLMSPAQ